MIAPMIDLSLEQIAALDLSPRDRAEALEAVAAAHRVDRELTERRAAINRGEPGAADEGRIAELEAEADAIVERIVRITERVSGDEDVT